MFAAEKGTRNLQPLFELHSDEITLTEPGFDGNPTETNDIALPSPSLVKPQIAELPPSDNVAGESPATYPLNDPEPSHAASHFSEASLGEAGNYREISISFSLDENFLSGKPVAFTFHGASGELFQHSDGQGSAPEQGTNSIGPDASSGLLSPPDEAHSINVTQLAEVDQDASIFVSGYIGEVVARLSIDQDLFMEQDVDIAFTIDGDGHFAVLLDQDMRIDQDVLVDIDIYDEQDVLYVNVVLRDVVEVTQDTMIDMRVSDGPLGGAVEVNRNIELEQDIDVQIDIEDDLDERYIVTTSVGTHQTVDVDQDAVVGVTDRDGEIDLDVDMMQAATIDQETIVHVDFVQI
jgi:hypothetical protein